MESHLIKWLPEIRYNMFIVFFVVLFAIAIKKIGNRIRDLEKKHTKKPKTSYVAKRIKICQYLEKNVEDGSGRSVTRMEWIRDLSSQIVAGNLKKPFPAFLRSCEKTEELEKKLRDELEVLYETIFRGRDKHLKQEQQFYRALAFELKNRMVRNPFDIQNHRRCYVIESLFSDIWSKNNPTKMKKITSSCDSCFSSCASCFSSCASYFSSCASCFSSCASCFSSCASCFSSCASCFSSCASCFSACCPTKYDKFAILKVLGLVGILTVGLICYDYYTDIQVLIALGILAPELYQMRNWFDTTKNESARSLLGKIVSAAITNKSSSHDLPRDYPESEMIVSYLNTILMISTLLLLIHNPLKLLARQVKTSLKLASATVEESREDIPYQAIIQRYKLPINEAEIEAGLQIGVQWGAYFSISLLLSMLMMVEGTLATEGISTLDSQLKFETLWYSGLGSIASLSLAQLKANCVQNELNTSFMQNWLLYFPACLLNALSCVMITVGLVTAGLDLHNFSPVIQNVWLKLCMMTLGLVIIVYGFCAAWFTTLLLTPPKSNILPVKSFPTLLQSLQLPTSQITIARKGFLSYHTSTFQSPSLLRLIQIQFLAYIIFLIPTVALNIATSVLIEYHPTMIALSQTTNLTDFTPYSVSLARRHLMIHSSYGIPVGVIMSYVFLAIYFECDNGFFSVANIEFQYKGKDETYSDLDGENNNISNTCEAMELEQNEENDEGNRASTNEDNPGTEQWEDDIERPLMMEQDGDGGSDTQCCSHKFFGRSSCCKSQETPVIEQIAEAPSWFDKSVEDDSKNPWYLRARFGLPNLVVLIYRKAFGLPISNSAVIPDGSFNGVWMDLGGNNTESESDEDIIEDSEILNRVKSSFYYYKNINEDEEETPV